MAVAADALALEDAQLLSTFPVTNNAVDDVNTTGTLRWAIAQANAATSPSAIEFELGSGTGHDHTVARSARAEQHERCDHDLRWSGRGGGHRLRQQREPGVPGRLAVSPRRSRD